MCKVFWGVLAFTVINKKWTRSSGLPDSSSEALPFVCGEQIFISVLVPLVKELGSERFQF